MGLIGFYLIHILGFFTGTMGWSEGVILLVPLLCIPFGYLIDLISEKIILKW